MTYVQPTVLEEMGIRAEHEKEKEVLKKLDETVDYKINNPELAAQRDKVRRLKDKIILIEAYNDYPHLRKFTCAFPVDDKCEGKINHTFYNWVIYGNCCKNCNQTYNRATPSPYGEEPRFVMHTAWDDLSPLDNNEVDV